MFEEDGDVGLGRYEYYLQVWSAFERGHPDEAHKFYVEVDDWSAEGGEPTRSGAIAAARRLAIRRARHLDQQR